MKPGFIEGLIGSWPGAILLGGFGVVASLFGIAMFQQQPLYGVVCMVAGILSVKHAVRARARVAHMREFGRQWARVAGWDEPPTRGVKGWLWWGIKSLAFFALAGACAAVSFMLWGDSPIEKGRSDFVVIFWVLFATLLGVMFRRHIYAFWLARKERKRRYEEGSEVDGKHLPRQFVEQALSAPMRSPGAAWFTQELPEYCLPLLKRGQPTAADAADDDSIEEAPDPSHATEKKPRFAVPTKMLAQGALLTVVVGFAFGLQPYLSPFLDTLKGRATAPAVADAPLQGSNTPPLPDRVEFMRWAHRVLGQSESDAVAMWEDAKAGGENQSFFSTFYVSKGMKAEASAWAQFTAARGGIKPPVPPQQQPTPPALPPLPDVREFAAHLEKLLNMPGDAQSKAEFAKARLRDASWDSITQFNIAEFYLHTKENLNLAIPWYQLAAAQGHGGAKEALYGPTTTPPAVASQTDTEKGLADYYKLAEINVGLAKSRRAEGKAQEAAEFEKMAAEWRRRASELGARATLVHPPVK